MTRLNHCFAVEHAEKYGIECAILIHHFQFWIEQNQAMGRNFIDGRTWVFQTQKEISSIYPYMSEDMVFKYIKKLVDEGVLITANYNKSQLNKTLWYAFKNEKMFTKPSNDGMETVNRRNASRQSTEYIRKDTNKKDTNKKDTKQQQQYIDTPVKQAAAQKAAAAGEEKKNFFKEGDPGMIKLINAKGEEYTVEESDLWLYMLNFPYQTLIVQKAIAQLKKTKDPVGDPFKLLESICKRLVIKPQDNLKSSKVKPSGPPKYEGKGTSWNEVVKKLEEKEKSELEKRKKNEI
ncbi:MAG: hypothetical protein ABFD00_10515 [Chloroherpetonaceae bacterium]